MDFPSVLVIHCGALFQIDPAANGLKACNGEEYSGLTSLFCPFCEVGGSIGRVAAATSYIL
ncbi:hypothetical protein FIU95_03550 [Microbulbifer sp. THAF38]|nr:hypothetical protein FIU95_03550 [Microbulbifer sp. THAF38]